MSILSFLCLIFLVITVREAVTLFIVGYAQAVIKSYNNKIYSCCCIVLLCTVFTVWPKVSNIAPKYGDS